MGSNGVITGASGAKASDRDKLARLRRRKQEMGAEMRLIRDAARKTAVLAHDLMAALAREFAREPEILARVERAVEAALGRHEGRGVVVRVDGGGEHLIASGTEACRWPEGAPPAASLVLVDDGEAAIEEGEWAARLPLGAIKDWVDGERAYVLSDDRDARGRRRMWGVVVVGGRKTLDFGVKSGRIAR